jgi:lysophospholipase L1-like esterase
MNSETNNIITIYIAGDSTACNYGPESAPRAGWGQIFQGFFDNGVAIRNEAISGRSSRSFIEEGALDLIKKDIRTNDYLFIQFGHNDEKIEDPTRYTEPDTSFKECLTRYIDTARNAGAFPVLITPVNRNKFGGDGKLEPTHGKYPKATIELAETLKVPLIDLTAMSKKLFKALGQERMKEIFLHLEAGENPNYPEGIIDNTHFQVSGAIEIAKLIIKGIHEISLPVLEKHLIKPN